MSSEPLTTQEQNPTRQRRPRIMLMGEFSAGKSTLANLMLGQGVSPVRVTATQLPPVWYAYGAGEAIGLGKDGVETPIPVDAFDSLSPHDTRAVKVFLDAEVLEFCDLIDMPGTSDPNMSADIWEDMTAQADAVIWCTPATQAWRQSEAAIWETLPDRLWSRSLLLITRMDKLLTERDQSRVVARVRREVEGYFQSVFPISLSQAIAAGEDEAKLEACGAAGFVEALIGLVDSLANEAPDPNAPPDMFSDPLDNVPSEEAPRPEVSLTVVAENDLGADAEAPIAAEWGDTDIDEDDDDDTRSLFAADEEHAGVSPISPRRVQRDSSRRARTRPHKAAPQN